MKEKVIASGLAASLLCSSLLMGCASTPDETFDESLSIRESIEETVESQQRETENFTEYEVPTEEETLNTESATESVTEPSTLPTIPVTITEVEPTEYMTTVQRNSLNMLNYITVLTQSINESSASRMYLEAVQAALMNDIYPNAVDTTTQRQINSLWNTIDQYRMISVKRERLEYIYEQNRAQALRKAIPNPLGLLSAVQSGNMLKTAVSVLYMAVDAKASYDAATTEADMQYLQGGWELEDDEMSTLSANQLSLLNYMLDMVRANDFPGEYALTEASVKDFVRWSNETNLTRKLNWLESHEDVYSEFRTYWLELTKSYYEAEQYSDCLVAFKEYENVATRIFRKDRDLATVIPMVIVAAQKSMTSEEYLDFADTYLDVLLGNCSDHDWLLRYFAAQICIDLYGRTFNADYLNYAYEITYNNVNILVDDQKKLNAEYLAELKEADPETDSKREKQEVKEYNKYLRDKRKTELPPVSEAFYLNCDLLFALADELNLTLDERKDIDDTIHENGTPIFLTRSLDNQYWASSNELKAKEDDFAIAFDGKNIKISASCLTDRSIITVSTSTGTIIDDWVVQKVDRPKESVDCAEFSVLLTSEKAKEIQYAVDEEVQITVTPVSDSPANSMQFTFVVRPTKIMFVFDGIEFERILK